MQQVHVFGASGYSGLELLRWLAWHPAVEVASASASSWAGERVASKVAGFPGALSFAKHEEVEAAVAKGDLAFLATPAETSVELAPRLLDRGARVIDLSGAFRLARATDYPEWYGFEHHRADLLKEAVYGLAELAPVPASARLVANPGCYATAAALASAPLVKHDLVERDRPIVLDGKSGTTGAGRSAKEHLLFSEVAETLRPYRLARHQHTPEIEKTLGAYAGREVMVSFTAHLAPLRRGLIVAAYAQAREGVTQRAIDEAYRAAYAGRPFVRVLPEGRWAEPGPVAYTNLCDVSATLDPRTRTIIAFGAIDNLVKGAAGQAIQNMNALLGLPETAGLAGVQR